MPRASARGRARARGTAGSGRSNTVISPARYWPGWPYRRATPGCASSVVRKHSSASCFASYGEHLCDVEHGQQRAVLGRQRHLLAARCLGDRECHGQRPDGAVGELHALDDALVVGAAHEAAQRRERSAGEHVEVCQLAPAERDPLERLDALGALAGARDERSAVRGDQSGGHAATAALTRPRCSR